MMTTRIQRIIVLLMAIAGALAASHVSAGDKDESARRRLPEPVARAVEENRPGAEVATLDVEKDGGITLYDIEFKAGRGEIEVAEDGTVLDVTDIVEMKDVPEAAASVIQKAARGGAIRQVERSEVRARIDKGRLARLATPEYVYEAELARGGEVEVAADGRIIKAPKFVGKASPEK
jgi:hypothetical protein